MASPTKNIGYIAAGLIVLYAIGQFTQFGSNDEAANTPVMPNWAAIASWPGIDAAEVEALPDPNRVYTAIVLDDSGSMGQDMEAAKTAVLASLEAMKDTDAVAVIALNDGLILPFMAVADARTALPAPLSRVFSDGSTPLTRALKTARQGLAEEAAKVGGFGTYRILVTTDGVADNGDLLRAEIEDIARQTPIQIATIGVGLTGQHVLRRPDLAAFVSVSDVSGLADALRTAIAEEQVFSAITSFGSE
ncbi:MAG: VWA domain-containing protein [Yoonia sp.]|uniref:vWA domain-containing protein n=1 Tax=Yoonia sp. TaxID=2212373 RepID=UPI00273EC1C5|nr:vWA domain-containing protein [Yoonia sp.]MDP5085426.1 VWA domain-containing protein [Yoonia sp.]MDP5361466.1 VWA domain-containing protein [Paracoccaceae bacterium]